MITTLVRKMIGTNPVTGGVAYAGDVTAWQAWDMLTDDSSAMLIDVRTRAEWDYVGRPDLAAIGKSVHLVQWQTYPDMAINPDFIKDVQATGSRPDTTILLLCRSGQRSMYAATALAGAGYSSCYNIADGFEGPRDQDDHRGTSQGWKAVDLPWTQD